MEMLIQVDKHLHFAAGFFILLIAWVLIQKAKPIHLILVVAAAGLGKELLDQYTYGGFDAWDWAFTVAGGLLALAVLIKLEAVGWVSTKTREVGS